MGKLPEARWKKLATLLVPGTARACQIKVIVWEGSHWAWSGGDATPRIDGLAGNDAKSRVDCGDGSAGGGAGPFMVKGDTKKGV